MRFLTAFSAMVLSVIVAILIVNLIFENTYKNPKRIRYGVSFSPNYAKFLGLDWQKTYLQILDELKVKSLRIPTFWDVIEKDEGRLDFSQTDFMLDEAKKAEAKVVLVVGARQPRWPECHIPNWAKKLSSEKRQQKTLALIEAVVTRYKGSNAVSFWQVENEPLVSWFGQDCDKPDGQFLLKEVDLVKQTDPTRLVMITDSGEWGNWLEPMKLADILGVSLYRNSYNTLLNSYINYPIPPWVYLVKSNMSKKFTSENKTVLISELQAEPWIKESVIDTSLKEQIKLFSLENFQQHVLYAQKTGFDEAYLWGVEWWYYMAKQGYPQYLEYAKNLF
ncbi:cellulase family glycosylhydrolase [Candidatus Daviesbacteria bacterium]|nr:cellulase family glycosylhydrolase [Candidatus Daviesbacteria bacterium]